MKGVRQWLVTSRGVGVMGKWKGLPHEEMQRCHAKTRAGGLCGHYAMKNGRCRYHGGKSTGAKNPHRSVKHGRYTKEAIKERRLTNQFLRESIHTVMEIEEITK